MEERFAAVTAATGALGPVLKKLTALLGEEHKLQEGTRRDIVSIKSELEPVHDLLEKFWGREDPGAACKDWMAEARELSYDMEDYIDGFALGLERGDGGLIIQRETTDDGPFKEFMERVKSVSKRCGEMEEIGNAIVCNSSKLTTDPRALFLHKDALELVGMERKKEKLIGLLQEHEMVCIVGFAGMGKTTLADLVHNTIGDQFQCRAFVSVHPRPNMMEILGTILSQVTNGATSSSPGSVIKPVAEQSVINDISIFLSDKRYLVIIDDIWHWEHWEVIEKALPKNNLGCKIIITTRINTIAEKCRTEQGAHVYTQNFHILEARVLSDLTLNKYVPRDILDDKAEGLSAEIVYISCMIPLAVICLSSAWAKSFVQGEFEEWDAWISNVLDGFLSIRSLKPLVKSLCRDFYDLPVELSTCLLYCSMYPPGYRIERHCLVRKWFAEGFVWQQEVAEAYIDQLISRNLLQPAGENTYTVHRLMLDFLLCKANEDNFVTCRKQYNAPGSSSHTKQIHRLSLYTDCYPDEGLSHTRSLAVLGPQPQLDRVPLKNFKKLLVLEIDSENIENGHLANICGLILLRYLGLSGCPKITELPQNIGELKNLETLDVRRTGISKLRKEIRNLKHLRTLDVRDTEVREVYWDVANSLCVIFGDMCSARVVKMHVAAVGPDGVTFSSEASCREDIYIVLTIPFDSRSEHLHGPMLIVAGRHMNIPQWVKQDLRNVCTLDIRLCKLGRDDLYFLKQMPNLQALQLRFEVLPQEPIAITGGGFSKLETFYVDCRMPRVTFRHEAMLKLRHLEFKFYNGPAKASPDYSMGIKNLVSLEKVVFRCSAYYTSEGPGISSTIEVVRKEAAEHPNDITLCFNNRKPEVFVTGAKWISQADKAIIQKETEERKRIREQRERLYKISVSRVQRDKILRKRGIYYNVSPLFVDNTKSGTTLLEPVKPIAAKGPFKQDLPLREADRDPVVFRSGTKWVRWVSNIIIEK